MEEAKACSWEMVVARLRGVVSVVSNFRHQWLPTMLEPIRLANHQIFNDEVVKTATVGLRREISTGIGDSKGATSHRCRSSSPQWAITKIRTQTPVSFNLDTGFGAQ